VGGRLFPSIKGKKKERDGKVSRWGGARQVDEKKEKEEKEKVCLTYDAGGRGRKGGRLRPLRRQGVRKEEKESPHNVIAS